MARSIVLPALFLLALSCAVPVTARPLVDIAVIDRDSGEWLSEIRHRGQDWISGVPGHRFAVRLNNNSGQRVLVVLSVDGVNAVTGDTADPAQAGYVLNPWQSTEIAGWRKSFDDVAQFVFTDLPDSYAARTGRPDHVGVIGIAVFEEARPIHHEQPLYAPPASDATRERATGKAARASAGSMASESSAHDQAAQRIGTGHGAREWSPVSRTGFVRASRRPTQVRQLRYDDRATLVARGVLPREPRYPRPYDHPRAFPGGFVADPPHPPRRW